jgi:multiple sugar transport system permease protein
MTRQVRSPKRDEMSLDQLVTTERESAAPAIIRKRWSLSRPVLNILMIVIGLVFLLPLLWLIFASFNPNADSTLALPKPFSLQNYHLVIRAGAGAAIGNSLYLAGVSTVIATAVSTMAAFMLARRKIRFKGLILVLILFLTGLPITLLLIPTYQIFVQLNWLNSKFYTSLVLASMSVPFSIWLLKNFIGQVPGEFEEAAAIEGASEISILFRIVIPLITPGILVAAILTFINSWGSFLIPLILDANPSDTPGAVGIYQFMSANGQVQFGQLAAYSVLFSVPVIILYLISSRWLSGGFSFAGGVKG